MKPVSLPSVAGYFTQSQLRANIIARKQRIQRIAGAAAPLNFSHVVSISMGPAAVSRRSTMESAAAADIGMPSVAAYCF